MGQERSEPGPCRWMGWPLEFHRTGLSRNFPGKNLCINRGHALTRRMRYSRHGFPNPRPKTEYQALNSGRTAFAQAIGRGLNRFSSRLEIIRDDVSPSRVERRRALSNSK